MSATLSLHDVRVSRGDHRVLDGATAARFLRDLITTLEEPLRIVVGPSSDP